MGVGLYYRAVGPVAPDVAQAVRAESASVGRGQPWVLCEPPHFFDAEDGELVGGSKLNLMPHPEELADLRANLPERSDLRVIFHSLTDWATRFGLTWELDVDDAHLCRIEPGDDPDQHAELYGGLAEFAFGLDELDPESGGGRDSDPADDPPTGPRLYTG